MTNSFLWCWSVDLTLRCVSNTVDSLLDHFLPLAARHLSLSHNYLWGSSEKSSASQCSLVQCQVKTFPSTFCLCKLYRGWYPTQTVKGKCMIWFETGRGRLVGTWRSGCCFFLFSKKTSGWRRGIVIVNEWMKTVNSKRFEEGEILFQTICWISVHHITPEEKKCELPTRNSWVILGTNIQWSTWNVSKFLFLQADLGFQDLWRQLFEKEAPKLEVKALNVGLACGMEMIDHMFFRYAGNYIFYGDQTILYHRTLHIWWCDSTRFVLNRYAESKSTRWRNSRKT